MGRFVSVTQSTAIVIYLLAPQSNSNCCWENNRWLPTTVTLGNTLPRSTTKALYLPKDKNLKVKYLLVWSHKMRRVGYETTEQNNCSSLPNKRVAVSEQLTTSWRYCLRLSVFGNNRSIRLHFWNRKENERCT